VVIHDASQRAFPTLSYNAILLGHIRFQVFWYLKEVAPKVTSRHAEYQYEPRGVRCQDDAIRDHEHWVDDFLGNSDEVYRRC